MESLGHWSYEETQALIGVWSEDKIQKELEGSFRNEKVYKEVSDRLAAMGMSRSAKQCRDKIKKLKEEYRKIKKESERSGAVRKTFRWYNAMDAVMSSRPGNSDPSDTMIVEFMISDVETDSSTITDIPGGCVMPGHTDDPQESGFYPIKVETDWDGPSTSTAVTSTVVQTTAKDTLCCWSHEEVQALLTLWANPTTQQELLLNVRNNKVYNCLSAQMESLGFNKTAKKCREKIKKLKQEYKRIKNGHLMGRSSSVWFSIMDEVLGSQAETAEPSSTDLSLHNQMDVWDEDMSEEALWLPDEVQVLMTLWAQQNIQKQLLTPATNNQVFIYLSNELELIGFNKTPHQCRLKVESLQAEYRKLKHVEPHREGKGDWFDILDGILGPDSETFREEDSSAALTEPRPDERVNDTSHSRWTYEEVKVLLSCWAEDRVQEDLKTTPRNERVFAQLSSELAMHGFNKTTSQCRSKIRVLKQKYKKIKEQNDLQKQKSRWFTIMDEVLSRSNPEAAAGLGADSDPEILLVPQQDLNEPVRACGLSVSSLCLLVPTLRLMCAFSWQAVRCRNVVHYRKVEELVKVVTQMVPELLTPRETVQLLLRLRARLVLELCVNESTANHLNIQPHLQVIQDLTISCCDQEELEELENSKSNFVEVVHTLIEDMEERRSFFKEVFPIYYGQQYEVTLQALVWKFISRLDNLLAIPDIKQTAEWLSTSPSLMEHCGEMVLDPDQLKEVLHFHQKQTGSTNTCFSQPQDVLLPLPSLHPKTISQQLPSEEASTDEEDQAQLDYEDEEEHQAGGDDNAVLKIKEEESDEYLHLQTCSMCPYSDSQVSGLLQHIRSEHLTQPPPEELGEDPILQTVSTGPAHTPDNISTAKVCEICGKAFKNISSLNRHVKRHTLSFHCDKCDKKYTSKDSLNVHRRIHTGETPYLCSHCGQGFRSSYTLSLHVRIHTGERRYKCHICGKTSIQHLARHMRMHRGEKNYLCTVCGKAFLSSGELKLHMRFHTGERPYTCKYCGRGFIAKCLLTVHTRQHTGERPYKCSLCPKSFRILRAQKRHMMIHSNKKSFQCFTCGKIFRQEDTFKIHIETHNNCSLAKQSQ